MLEDGVIQAVYLAGMNFVYFTNYQGGAEWSACNSICSPRFAVLSIFVCLIWNCVIW